MTLNGSTLCRYEDKRGQAEKAKTQRKAECRKRTVFKSLPEKSAIFCRWINVASIVIVLHSNG